MTASKPATAAAAGPHKLEMGAFQPCVWGDFFVTYNPPLSQSSEMTMQERVEQLKVQVRALLEDNKNRSVADVVTLVEMLERLGIGNHFRGEIGTALRHVLNEEPEFPASSDDLHIAALRFRLLRQHGLWVSADIFDKFKDETGNFSTSLCSDPVSLLSLYNAAHLATPSEDALSDAIVFSRYHLEAMRNKLRPPMAEQVSCALDIPLPRTVRQLETMHYIKEYEQDESNNGPLLELSRLDFELVRSLHLKELRDLSLWWRDLYDNVKLSYARDRLVENYFWTCSVFHEEEYSRARLMFAKTFGLLSLMDDTYDVHATLEDCYKLNEAIQRWDRRAVSILPKYLHMFYIRLLANFREFEDTLGPHEKYRVSYAKTAFQSSSEYYLCEAKWSNEKYAPSFKEHLEVSRMSSGFPTLALVLLMGVDNTATNEAFDWAADVPDIVCASGVIAHFLNDIASYKLGKTKKDVASSVECYMKENLVGGQEAIVAISALAEDAWRMINRACMEIEPALLPAAQLVVNLTRTLEVIYLGGRDGYTFGGDLKGLIAALFLKPIYVV
ncbi:eudesmanediol synthase [Triticum aestivum]|nr:eudesmanediol synthase-like [Triticum aestivum]